MGDLGGLGTESSVRSDDLGHVGWSGAVLGVVHNGCDRGRGEASHGGGSDSSGETHFDIRWWVGLSWFGGGVEVLGVVKRSSDCW